MIPKSVQPAGFPVPVPGVHESTAATLSGARNVSVGCELFVVSTTSQIIIIVEDAGCASVSMRVEVLAVTVCLPPVEAEYIDVRPSTYVLFVACVPVVGTFVIVGVVENVVLPVTVDVAESASVPEMVEEEDRSPPVNVKFSVRSRNACDNLPRTPVTGTVVVEDCVALK